MSAPAPDAGLPDLPVRAVLGDVAAALARSGTAVLAAPPGAGKTTLVPLALLTASWRGDRRIILVEPRRLAARAAARRMAALLGETVGERVGYRMRLDTRVSRRTVIEVVTDGVFSRMALDDPELAGVAAVIFDEFHERALDADFGLALALDIREGLRPDLRIMVMSATLDTAGVAGLLGGAAVVESAGRSFPVEIRHRERAPGTPLPDAVAEAVRAAHRDETGSILAFLPGQGEIRRAAEVLENRFGADTMLVPLHGQLSGADQDRAIRPAPPGMRKIVLATAIAETSITIDGVRVVVDGGFARQPVFEPATGITRLETVRVSRASADQRAGRAGRTEPGVAIRLWRAEQTAALAEFAPPEMRAADLSGLVLDCLSFGVAEPDRLAFLDPPPAAALVEARRLLGALGAVDGSGALTARGRAMRALGLPVRAAAMVLAAVETGEDAAMAAELAVLLGEPGLGGGAVDLAERLRAFRAERHGRARAAAGLARRIADQARRAAARPAAGGPASSPGDGAASPQAAGTLLLSGFPDRVAGRRGAPGRYRLANGRGAVLDEADPLAASPFIVVADLTGRAGAHRVLAAAAVDRAAVESRLGDSVREETETRFDRVDRRVKARRLRRIGRLVLDEAPLPRPAGEAAAAALAKGVRGLGLAALPWDGRARQLRARLGFLYRTLGPPWPDVADDALLDRLETWFVPFQSGVSEWDAIAPAALAEGLLSLVPGGERRMLDRLAPTHYEAPTGTRLPVDYAGDDPAIAVRVQELFGLDRHPALAGGRLPLTLHLLSPAGRPIQTTRDLPGFWRGSWADVRADMRGRYPKHYWPQDPAAAEPTRRAGRPR